MPELVVIGYPDATTASVVLPKVQQLQREFVIDGSVATVTRDADGKMHVETPTGAVAGGAATGALWGGLIGLLFFVPIGGLIVGGLMGAIMGKAVDMGIDDEFRKQVQDVVQPGNSALVLIFTKVTPDKALAALGPYGGKVLRTSLTKEAEEELNKALAQAK
jgi:uncharacterized membrane protein